MPAFALDWTIPLPAQPLTAYSWLQRSLFLAHLARAAYEPPEVVSDWAGPLADRIAFWDRHGAQAYWLETPHDYVLAFRGTEPDDWNDWRADLDADWVSGPAGGRVHHGFWAETADLWPEVSRRLQRSDRPVWITGHSLGGAIAIVTASRIGALGAAHWVRGIYTFGTPRAGDAAFVRAIDLPHYRWVHNNDLVPQLPPAWMGFVHHGRQAYVDRRGRLKQWSGWERWFDRIRGWLAGLCRFRLDGIGDHAIDEYTRSIETIVRRYAPLASVPQRLGAPRRRAIRRTPLRRAA